MKFKFKNKTYEEIFVLICNNIKTNNFWLDVIRNYSGLDGSKLRVVSMNNDLQINVTLNTVYKNKKVGLYRCEGGLDCQLSVNVRKKEIEYGNDLLKGDYYYRMRDAKDSLTTPDELITYLITLINSNKPLGVRPRYTPIADRREQQKIIDTEIKQLTRNIKIDSIL